MTAAGELLEWVKKSEEFGRHFPKGDAVDAALDRRDDPEFERAWLSEQQKVRRRIRDKDEAKLVVHAIGAVAESAFRRTFDLSLQHDEFAAAVSEDLELLAEAATVGYSSDTLEALWVAYSQGKFPTLCTPKSSLD